MSTVPLMSAEIPVPEPPPDTATTTFASTDGPRQNADAIASLLARVGALERGEVGEEQGMARLTAEVRKLSSRVAALEAANGDG